MIILSDGWIYSEEEIAEIPLAFRANWPEAKVLCLEGELGTGKTALARAFLKHLAPEANVTSPTFNLVNVYPTNEGPIYHVDLYRLQSEEAVAELDPEQWLNEGRFVLVEWPRLLKPWLDALPPGQVATLNLTTASQLEREIHVRVP